MASAHHAGVAAAALAVDPELNPDKVAKTVAADGADVVAELSAVDARNLRLAVSAYMDMLSVTLRTLREFGS